MESGQCLAYRANAILRHNSRKLRRSRLGERCPVRHGFRTGPESRRDECAVATRVRRESRGCRQSSRMRRRSRCRCHTRRRPYLGPGVRGQDPKRGCRSRDVAPHWGGAPRRQQGASRSLRRPDAGGSFGRVNRDPARRATSFYRGERSPSMPLQTASSTPRTSARPFILPISG